MGRVEDLIDAEIDRLLGIDRRPLCLSPAPAGWFCTLDRGHDDEVHVAIDLDTGRRIAEWR